MDKRLTRLALALALALPAAAAVHSGPVIAQVAGGSTTASVSITESTQIAMGWSVKTLLLGKTLYNDAGDKVGKVEDPIISPDRSARARSACAERSARSKARCRCSS